MLLAGSGWLPVWGLSKASNNSATHLIVSTGQQAVSAHANRNCGWPVFNNQ
jgi:hypothetical protein